jgi:hypothetical protein
MQPHMILIMPFQTTAGTVRRLRISLPLIADLIDGRKFFRPTRCRRPLARSCGRSPGPRLARRRNRRRLETSATHQDAVVAHGTLTFYDRPIRKWCAQ